MKKFVIPFAVLLGLLLLGSTSLAVGPERLWWTEFTSEVFTWTSLNPCTYFFEGSDGSFVMGVVDVTEDAPAYRGTVLIRPWHMQVRTDEPGLNCVTVDPPRIRPGQPVRFHVGWVTEETMTHAEAEALFGTLTYTVLSDCEPQYSVELVRKDAEDLSDNLGYSILSDSVPLYRVELERQGTHPADEDTDFTKAFCPWTVRP